MLLSLVRMFRRMDDDGSKALAFAEFKKGLEDSGMDMSDEQYKAMPVNCKLAASNTELLFPWSCQDLSEILIATLK